MNDEELKKIGLFVEDNASNLYELTNEKANELFEIRTKKDHILVGDSEERPNRINVGKSGGGSNCWVVHGNYTESGEPLLSCDPHLGKLIHSTWYPIRISWTVS